MLLLPAAEVVPLGAVVLPLEAGMLPLGAGMIAPEAALPGSGAPPG